MLRNHLTKWGSIDGKKQRIQNWALTDPKREINLAGKTFTKLNLMTSASQIGSQPPWALPVTPTQSSSRPRSIEWSMVSNVAERSTNVIAVTLPSSMADMISLWIFSSAFSVEWDFLYADWNWLKVFVLERWEYSRHAAVFSRIFERKLRLDTGR